MYTGSASIFKDRIFPWRGAPSEGFRHDENNQRSLLSLTSVVNIKSNEIANNKGRTKKKKNKGNVPHDEKKRRGYPVNTLSLL